MNRFEELFRHKKMTLIMSLPVNDADMCRAAFEAGADAVKVHINLHHNAGGEDLGGYTENREVFMQMLSCAKGPMGIVPGASAEGIMKDIEKVRSSGFEFVSFYTKFLPVRALPLPQTLMVACDGSFTYPEIAAYERLGAGVLEASVIPSSEYGQPLNFRDLATYASISANTKLPVVVPTQRAIGPEDVKYLWQSGVRGLMIGAVVTGKSVSGVYDAVAQYRREIDKL